MGKRRRGKKGSLRNAYLMKEKIERLDVWQERYVKLALVSAVRSRNLSRMNANKSAMDLCVCNRGPPLSESAAIVISSLSVALCNDELLARSCDLFLLLLPSAQHTELTLPLRVETLCEDGSPVREEDEVSLPRNCEHA